jgi:hypothetical protein
MMIWRVTVITHVTVCVAPTALEQTKKLKGHYYSTCQISAIHAWTFSSWSTRRRRLTAMNELCYYINKLI